MDGVYTLVFTPLRFSRAVVMFQKIEARPTGTTKRTAVNEFEYDAARLELDDAKQLRAEKM